VVVFPIDLPGTRSAAVHENQFVQPVAQLGVESAERLIEGLLPTQEGPLRITRRPIDLRVMISCSCRAFVLSVWLIVHKVRSRVLYSFRVDVMFHRRGFERVAEHLLFKLAVCHGEAMMLSLFVFSTYESKKAR